MNKCKIVIFSHGKKSGPEGIKILELSKIAERYNYETISLDYRECKDETERILKLEDFILRQKDKDILLVGSSMGGYISTVIAENYKLTGLFLMCPAFYLKTYKHQKFAPLTTTISIVHGKNDETVPYQNSLSFAEKHVETKINLVDDNHRLGSSIEEIKTLFITFLDSLIKD